MMILKIFPEKSNLFFRQFCQMISKGISVPRHRNSLRSVCMSANKALIFLVYEIETESRFHFDRIARSHCDHCDSRCAAATGIVPRQALGQKGPLLEQHASMGRGTGRLWKR